jgi:endonuclease/exonuclease/phosphatase family metal-dependent hydrolase
MPYYRFVPAIDFMGGKYGTLILSKHPIVSFELIRLPKGGKEERTAGHVAVDLDGVSLDFFNTHLAFDGKAERAGQFAELGRVLSGYRRFVLTGDFNTGDFTEFDPIACGTLVNREDARKVTFPGSRVCIDNIVLSEGIEELSASVTESDLSDHWMLSADIRITF